MKRLVFAASALALGTAVSANEPEAHDHSRDMTPDTMETSVYDGPNSYTPSQPPPVGDGQIMAQRLDLYRPVARASYPVCTTEIRDNCVQRIDPGGSDVELAAQGTLNVDTGMGGPEIE